MVVKLVDNIRTLCRDKNVSINKVEFDCGIGKNTILKWDTHEPSIGKVKKVADYFGVLIDDLVVLGE